MEGRRCIHVGSEFDPTLQVTLGQQFGAVGAQAPAPALGRERALEDLQPNLLGHTPGIVHPETGDVAHVPESDRHRLAGLGGLQGVLDQVDQNPVQKILIGADGVVHFGEVQSDFLAHGAVQMAGAREEGFHEAGHTHVVERQFEVGFFRAQDVAVSLDLFDETIGEFPGQGGQFTGLFGGLGILGQVDHAADIARCVQHIVEERALQNLPAPAIGDVLDGQDGEGFAFVVERGRRDLQLVGFTAFGDDAALPGIGVATLGRQDGAGGAAIAAVRPGAATQWVVPGVAAPHEFPGAQPQQNLDVTGTEGFDQFAIGADDLPVGVQDGGHHGNGVQEI